MKKCPITPVTRAEKPPKRGTAVIIFVWVFNKDFRHKWTLVKLQLRRFCIFFNEHFYMHHKPIFSNEFGKLPWYYLVCLIFVSNIFHRFFHWLLNYRFQKTWQHSIHSERERFLKIILFETWFFLFFYLKIWVMRPTGLAVT